MERSEQQTNVEIKFKIIIAYYINVKSTFFLYIFYITYIVLCVQIIMLLLGSVFEEEEEETKHILEW
ncbi:MAG: hypothetical protein ACI8RD_001685 [Bacillariaceae sp.]|jgi:hypothetical protein